jgi:hypothetical protein
MYFFISVVAPEKNGNHLCETYSQCVLESSWAFSRTNIEPETNVSETSPIPISRMGPNDGDGGGGGGF